LEDEELGLGGAEAQDGEDVPPPESASEGEDDAEPIVPVVVADPTSAEADTDERPPRARQAQRKAASAPLAPDSDTDEVPRSRKKGKRARRKDPAEDLFEAAEEAAGTPEPEAAPVDAEVGNEGAAAVPELSKRDKRRAREAAKKAREDTFVSFSKASDLDCMLRPSGGAGVQCVPRALREQDGALCAPARCWTCRGRASAE
jgi:DnaJ family protein A protein 5